MVEHNTFNVGVEGSIPSGVTKTNGSLAQWLEQWTHNPKVTGSSPVRSTLIKQLKTNDMSGRIKKLAIEDMRKEGISPIYIAFEEALLNYDSIEITIKFDGRKLNGGNHERKNNKY